MFPGRRNPAKDVSSLPWKEQKRRVANTLNTWSNAVCPVALTQLTMTNAPEDNGPALNPPFTQVTMLSSYWNCWFDRAIVLEATVCAAAELCSVKLTDVYIILSNPFTSLRLKNRSTSLHNATQKQHHKLCYSLHEGFTAGPLYNPDPRKVVWNK